MGIRSNLKSLSSAVLRVSTVATASLSVCTPSGAQPIPGAYPAYPAANMSDAASAAPIPGASIQTSSPIPGAGSVTGAPSFGTTSFNSGASKYAQLPLSIFDAQARLQELRTMASTTRPQEVLDSVNRLSEWLSDMTDAHNKMAATFMKHDELKLQAQAEKSSAHKFAAIRNQVQLLKATLLIQQHRFPEALPPLVDIVIAEPTTATGQSAYQKLKELGFAEDISTSEATPSSLTAEKTKEQKR
jgi:hypothetical protein